MRSETPQDDAAAVHPRWRWARRCLVVFVLYICIGLPFYGIASGARIGGDSGFIILPMMGSVALPFAVATVCGVIFLWPGVAALLPPLERSWIGLVISAAFVQGFYLVGLGLWFLICYLTAPRLAEALFYGFMVVAPMGGPSFLLARIGAASLRPGALDPRQQAAR